VVPADNKWFTRLIVGAAVTDCLLKINPEYPKTDSDTHNRLTEARILLESQ
jgi:hypothetical protein